MKNKHIPGKGKRAPSEGTAMAIHDTASIAQILITDYNQHKFTRVELHQINHQPALLFYDNSVLVHCQVFELDIHVLRIKRVFSITNPQRLKNIFSYT